MGQEFFVPTQTLIAVKLLSVVFMKIELIVFFGTGFFG